jgi:hypothetical protein
VAPRRIGHGEFAYNLDSSWSAGALGAGGSDGWARHGIAVTSAGEVVTFDAKFSLVHMFSLRAGCSAAFRLISKRDTG